jgi:hypothetical protein
MIFVPPFHHDDETTPIGGTWSGREIGDGSQNSLIGIHSSVERSGRLLFPEKSAQLAERAL